MIFFFYVKYLPRDFLLRHGEADEVAVGIAKLTSVHMEADLDLWQISQRVSHLIC